MIRRPANQLAGGPGVGSNVETYVGLANGPSVQSLELARTLALVTATASPASRGSGVWAGDRGFGVNRFEATLANAPTGSPTAGAIAPVAKPTGTRVGAGTGPSDPSGFPSTGYVVDPSVGMLDWHKLGKLGMKS